MSKDRHKSKRRYPRIPTPQGVWVAWQDGQQQNVSRVRDLNIGGLFIAHPIPSVIGATITILLSVSEGEIRTSAIVRNAVQGEGMGVEFTGMGQEAAVRLQTLITRLLRSSPAAAQ